MKKTGPITALLALVLAANAGATEGSGQDQKPVDEPPPAAPEVSVQRYLQPIAASAPESHEPIEFVLDDGTREADVGFNSTTAEQFMWFNRFEAPAAPFELREIQVLFPPGVDVVPGADIQLAVYRDPDGDPTNGAELLASLGATIQFADGANFSVYELDPPVPVGPDSGDVLVGVINRFVEPGVSPPSRPAALDTTASAGRSWIAVWTGVPPDMPTLPPDSLIDPIDVIEPGNWMIRAAGTDTAITEVPTLGGLGLAALAALLAMAAARRLRRA